MFHKDMSVTHPKFCLHDEVLALLPPAPHYALEEDLTRDIYGTRNATTRRKMSQLLTAIRHKYLGISVVQHRSGETRVSIQKKFWPINRLIAEDYIDSLELKE